MKTESAYIAAHRQTIRDLPDGLIQPASDCPPHYQISRIKAERGSGFADLYDFGRVIVGRGNFILHQAYPLVTDVPLHFFGVNILLAGAHHVTLTDHRQPFALRPPVVALRKGKLGRTRADLPERHRIQMLSLDFDQSLIKHFTVSGDDSEAVTFFAQAAEPATHLLTDIDIRLLHCAGHLLNLPCADNELDLIQLEGAALSLLALLLQNKQKPPHKDLSDAADEAVRILRHEYAHKITTRQLARRVGLNECDLKRVFKQRTGSTIAAFVREERMKLALNLLAEGSTLPKVALYTGYHTPSYFSRVFTRHFGYPPQNHARNKSLKIK